MEFKNNNLDAIFIPIGGGSISGIGLYIKHLYPDIKIIGVEPENANAMKQSLDSNKILELNKIDTLQMAWLSEKWVITLSIIVKNMWMK